MRCLVPEEHKKASLFATFLLSVQGFLQDERSDHHNKSLRCDDCNRCFFDQSCFDCHKAKNAAYDSNIPTCSRIWGCIVCSRDLKMVKGERTLKNYSDNTDHKCFKSFCQTCRSTVDKDKHFCYLRVLDAEEGRQKQFKERGVFVFFDIECLREEDGKMTTNLICLEDEFGSTWPFDGLDAMEQFCDAVFNKEGEIYRKTVKVHGKVTFMAHNGARFDFLPMMSKLQKYSAEDP